MEEGLQLGRQATVRIIAATHAKAYCISCKTRIGSNSWYSRFVVGTNEHPWNVEARRVQQAKDHEDVAHCKPQMPSGVHLAFSKSGCKMHGGLSGSLPCR